VKAVSGRDGLPARLPLFPLPNVVLFPSVPLPLHVFELRYRKMVEDALATHRTIGMTLLRPGYEADYQGRPPVYPIGCAGVIQQHERLDDGRFNILLLGRQRFRIVEEHAGEPYRLASVEALPDLRGDDRSLASTRDALVSALGRMIGDSPYQVVDSDAPAEVVVNGLAQGLDLPPVERQSLLECDTLDRRARQLLSLLEFHRLERTAGGGGAPN
jgi:Lon protease-like protein